ncbi:MAG: ABC transporter permease subunit, partial [Pseudomonadota bacterium]
MLWNDSRYRSSFLQVVALFVTLIALLYLVNNVRGNLADLGKEFGFTFMTTPASYDINQRPIDYTSRDSHARASVIGMMNTLIVAVVGCFLATVIGVLAGVARLSKNWIIRQLMTVYIEVVRNIPVLIQILLFSAIISETLPAPNKFRGADPEASMWFWESVAATNRGFYFPAPVMNDGSMWVIIALIAGIIGAIVFGRWAVTRQQQTGEILPVFPVKLGLIIGLPVVTFLVVAMAGTTPITLEYPELKGFNFQGGIFARESYVALTLALAIYTGAFIAENVRAGIQAVSKGQTEAAFALGLQPGRTMSLVILPQALRIIIPPMISQYLNLTKNSSLALLVGYMDATGTLGGITLNQTGKEFETLFLLMAFYLSVSLSIAAVMNLYNENSKLVERTSVTGGGFSFLNFFSKMNGDWELLKKGDAKMRPGYGIRGVLNLFVLFYAIVLVLLLHFVFVQHEVLTQTYANVLIQLKDSANIELALSSDLAAAFVEVFKADPTLASRADTEGPEAAEAILLRLGDEDLRTVMQQYMSQGVAGEVTSDAALSAANAVQDSIYLRDSYYKWATFTQLASLGMIAMAFGALITCIFKSPRFIDLAFLELIVFVIGVLAGFQFGLLTDSLSALMIVGGGLIIRVGIIGYTIFGAQPNLTFFNRERRV